MKLFFFANFTKYLSNYHFSLQNTALSWVMSGRAVPASDPLDAARPAEGEADEAKPSKQKKTDLLAI